jgi:hypothetical protein
MGAACVLPMHKIPPICGSSHCFCSGRLVFYIFVFLFISSPILILFRRFGIEQAWMPPRYKKVEPLPYPVPQSTADFFTNPIFAEDYS